MTIDLKRFTKLMMLTTSDSDGEALVALRKANEMLKQNEKSWHEFISLFPAGYSDPPRKPKAKPDRNCWKENANGNWVRFVPGKGVVTIFASGSGWRWVNDGRYCHDVFDDLEEAKNDWDLYGNE